jgi:two-component system LytT family response regulator
MTAVIIDDEQKGRSVLKQKLQEYCPQVELIGEAANGEQGISLIEKQKPQIVFLDIEMPRMSGFEMLQKISEQNFHLIFTTAYDQYAIQAIRHSAFDYLLKPVDIDELQSAIQKAENTKSNHPSNAPKIAVLKENLSDEFHLHKIAIPSMEGLLFFNLSDIIYLKAESNYSTVYFSHHPKLLTTRTLHDFDELLPPHLFFRPHHSYIINLSYIKRYIKGDGGQIEMTNGDYVDVSRSKKEEFLKIIR